MCSISSKCRRHGFHLTAIECCVPVRFVRFPREPHGFREPHHQRIRDTEEIAWLMKYARGIDWKAPDRRDDDRPATKTTEQ